MLKSLDKLELIPRKEGVKPFILLNGHQSRLELPFLRYVNDPDNHWIACIGVPYGTALWQVGDSKEQNGSFNMAMTREKQNLLEFKDTIGSQNDGIKDTDFMPLVNRAWAKSFARIDKNRNAISDRGWNPLNKALLLEPSLRSTMSATEKMDEYNQAKKIIPPNKNSMIVTDEDPFTSTGTTISNQGTTSIVTDQSSLNNNPSDEINSILNFSTGMSNFCLKAYLANEQLQEARESIRNDMASGKTIKEQLKESTWLSAGIIFKAGSLRLGKTVFDVHMDNLKEKNKVLIDKIKKERKAYDENVKKSNEIYEKKNGALESMTIRELTIICKPLKQKSDGKMPNKKEDLIQKYYEWSGRPAQSFDETYVGFSTFFLMLSKCLTTKKH